MDQRAAFLQAIHENPDDDTPRLVYADWLVDDSAVERGIITPADEARSEFIRLQCRPATTPYADPTRSALSCREQELQAKHSAAWVAAECGSRVPADSVRFRRGFPEHMDLTQRQWEDADLPAWTPVTSARIHSVENPGSLAMSSQLAVLTSLDLHGNDIDNEGAEALAASPYLEHLTTLNLSGCSISLTGVQSLATSGMLSHLSTLDLSDNDIGDIATQVLAAAPSLSNLTTLHLGSNFIGVAGAEALAASPFLLHLTMLDLRANPLDGRGWQALRQASDNPDSALCGMQWNGLLGMRSPEIAQEVADRLAARHNRPSPTTPDPNRRIGQRQPDGSPPSPAGAGGLPPH